MSEKLNRVSLEISKKLHTPIEPGLESPASAENNPEPGTISRPEREETQESLESQESANAERIAAVKESLANKNSPEDAPNAESPENQESGETQEGEPEKPEENKEEAKEETKEGVKEDKKEGPGAPKEEEKKPERKKWEDLNVKEKVVRVAKVTAKVAAVGGVTAGGFVAMGALAQVIGPGAVAVSGASAGSFLGTALLKGVGALGIDFLVVSLFKFMAENDWAWGKNILSELLLKPLGIPPLAGSAGGGKGGGDHKPKPKAGGDAHAAAHH